LKSEEEKRRKKMGKRGENSLVVGMLAAREDSLDPKSRLIAN